MTGDRTHGLAVRIFRGIVWSYGSLVGVRLMTLVSTAVLAHLVSPRDFGLVAVALIFTTALDAVRDLGVNQSLVVSDDITDHATTAFWFTALIGATLGLGLAAVSPLAADFFRERGVLALLAVLGINLPLRALGLTHCALAQRGLDFRSTTLAEIAEAVVRGAVGVALAFAGRGAWSLVFGYLSGTLVWTILLWTLVRWRPTGHAVWSDVPFLLRFGGLVALDGLIGSAMGYTDNVFVGRVLGPAALGKYIVGYRLPEMLISEVVAAAGLVLFPGFAVLDRDALRRAVIATCRYTFLLGFPIAVALITLAHPLVSVLFGSRWRGAAPVIQILTVAFVGLPMSRVMGSAYLATKRVDVLLKLAAPQGLLLVALLAIFTKHGIAAAAGCQAVVRCTFVPIGLYVSTRVLGLRLRELWGAFWPAVLASAGMAAVILPIERSITSPWAALGISCVVGGAVYLGLAWLLAAESLRQLWRLIRARGAASQIAQAGAVADSTNSLKGAEP